jgi:NAD(P)-dependent dehydrogenase (short-subunit alcohol dehydrogenase family)
MTGVFTSNCLEGRTALITGASSGIGAACARRLAASGAHVLLSGRHAQRLAAVAETCDGRATILPAELAEPDGPAALAEQVKSQAGALDVLVNSAGYGDVVSTTRIRPEDIDRVFAVNVRAPLLLASRLVPGMIARRRGSIVNISSVVGSMGTPFQAAYSATKGALDAMTRSLAREYGSAGIRVNSIAAGLIATEMWGDKLSDPALVEGGAQFTAVQAWGKPEMVADAVLFLACDASAYITGQTLFVDGGMVNTGNLIPPSFFGKPKPSP